MAYLMTDEEFERLQTLAQKVMDLNNPLQILAQRAFAAAIMFIIADATHIDIDIDTIRKRHGKRVEGSMMIEATAQFESLLTHLQNEFGGVVVTKVNDLPWFFADELGPQYAGLIPSFLAANDPRPLRTQLNENYAHGGGWRPTRGFKFNRKTWAIRYKDDKPMQPLGGAALNGELCVIYPDAWVMVMHGDDEREIARLDITSGGLH